MNLAQIDRFSSFTMNFIPHDTQTAATMYWVLHTILEHFGKTNGKNRRFTPYNSRTSCTIRKTHQTHTKVIYTVKKTPGARTFISPVLTTHGLN